MNKNVDLKARTKNGVVRNLRRGDEGSSAAMRESGERDQVLSFRLELTDASGDITGYLQVEMRGETIVGDVAEGDRVEVGASTPRDGIVTPKSFQNLTTNSRVYIHGGSVRKAIKIALFILIFIPALCFIIWCFLNVFGGFQSFHH
jgi:hypothetical protein